MSAIQKPELTLLSGEASLSLTIAFIESIAAKEMTAAGIEELKMQLSASNTPKPSRP